MASILRIKRSELSGNPAVLGAGELAYSALPNNGSNGGDRLYIGTGTESAGNAVNHVVIGGKYFTDTIDAATAVKTGGALVKRDNTGAAYLDVIGNITGNIVGNADTASKWLTPINLSLTGDATATFSNVDGSAPISTAITLANSGVTANTYGSATSIPIVTVNAKGLVTQVTTANIATTLQVAGTTGTDGVSLLTDTLNIVGGEGVTTTVTGTGTNTTVTINLSGAAALDDLTLGTLDVNSIQIAQTLDVDGNTSLGANLDVGGNVNIVGNLVVQGTTTTVNSTTVSIGDKNIELAKDASTQIEADGAGLTIVGPTIPATITYSALDDSWNMNKPLIVSTVTGNLIGNADTATAWETARDLILQGDVSGTLAAVDGTSNKTATLTLATVNSNVGQYGNSTTVPTVTVNGKGLVTAVSQTAIPFASTSTKGLASFDGTQFSITSGAVTIAQIDGGSF
jgi:hypothetical protein